MLFENFKDTTVKQCFLKALLYSDFLLEKTSVHDKNAQSLKGRGLGDK